jgi:molybdopterin-guanine dinucleotide biosynthesis protein A
MQATESHADIVIPVTSKDKYEPLFAFYRKRIVEVIYKTLSSGKRKITEVFPLCTVKHFEMDYTDWLMNINTKTEYEEYTKAILNQQR